ncbi:multiprotein bridging factor aMBF1 [Methanothermococcus okinawensis]|uniref:Transcriptional regulator, XRE family n=1 Tax=Methanothermococcus okinawensis (strain DSM 14208 / JCM 11175 / IH1) TaxID=647113 RepID=F8AMR3_METOI|nr:multiprotein bridging factor aMBF1 [Methanothermococcus okinawensis]AEH06894.1 transcriptional regulator, XRE family [Methanothermococcus okinawensis IH1]
MQCELCGKEVNKLITVRIEGVEMQVCEECAKFGVSPKSYSRKPKRVLGRGAPQKKIIKKPRRDLFDNLKELVEDYGTIIKEARMKKGMDLKELAKRVGIKESTLHKIERNELEPEEKYVKRLEKELNISLYEEGDEEYKDNTSRDEFTLGDFIKVKRRK